MSKEKTMITQDPVCNMTIEEKDAVGTSTYKGHPYHFCSEACKDKFDNNPDKYVNTAPDADKVEETIGKSEIFTCPMHPEVRQKGAGSCQKCGMALEPAAPSITPSKTEWTCPMHPEVVQS